jgi:hypothetical protein
MKLINTIVVIAALTMSGAFVAEGCTPAERAAASNIENVVLTDFEAGKTIDQIEADVEAAYPAIGDVVTVVDDALQVLIAAKDILGPDLAKAQTMRATLAAKHLAGQLR